MQVHQLRVVADSVEVCRVDWLRHRVVEVCVLRTRARTGPGATHTHTRCAQALEARLPCPHLRPGLQLEPDIHVVGILVMVQDLTKGISISGIWEPEVGRLLLLFLRPEHMAH